MSYISPIKLNTISEMEEGWTDKVAKYMAGEVDNLILESCMKVSCDVNKDELLKALQYDRGQYEKGYADGKRDAAAAIKALEMQLNKTGVFTEDGTEILKGDKVTGLFLYSKPITGTVIFKDGSFGIEWDRGGSMEFTPFTSTCNVKWKIVKEEEA